MKSFKTSRLCVETNRVLYLPVYKAVFRRRDRHHTSLQALTLREVTLVNVCISFYLTHFVTRMSIFSSPSPYVHPTSQSNMYTLEIGPLYPLHTL